MADFLPPIIESIHPNDMAYGLPRSAALSIRAIDRGGSKIKRSTLLVTVTVGPNETAVVSNGVVQQGNSWSTTTVDAYEEDEDTTAIDIRLTNSSLYAYGSTVEVYAQVEDNSGNFGSSSFTYEIKEDPVYGGGSPTPLEVDLADRFTLNSTAELFRQRILRSLISEDIPMQSAAMSTGSIVFSKQGFSSASMPGVVLRIPDGFDIKSFVFANVAGAGNGQAYTANPNWIQIDVGGDVGNGDPDMEAKGSAIRAYDCLNAQMSKTQVTLQHVYNGEENSDNYVKSIVHLTAPESGYVYDYPIEHDTYQPVIPAASTSFAGLSTIGFTYQGMSGGSLQGLEIYRSRMAARRLLQVLQKTGSDSMIRHLWDEEPPARHSIVRSAIPLNSLRAMDTLYIGEYENLKRYFRNSGGSTVLSEAHFSYFEEESIVAKGHEGLARCCMALITIARVAAQGGSA